MQDLNIGDTLYKQEDYYGTPRLFKYKIAKITPKQYILDNGVRVKKDNLREVGAYHNQDQYIAKPDEAFVARVHIEQARANAKDAADKLRDKIVNRKNLTKEQYESIVEFVKQFEVK